MSKSNTARSASRYLGRLAEDEYVQEQLRDAATRVRQAYRRAARQRAKAAEDKQLYANLRDAATSVRNALTALQRPKPKPRRRGPRLVVLVLAGGGTALVINKRRGERKVAVQGLSDPAGSRSQGPGGYVVQAPTDPVAQSAQTPAGAGG